MWRTTLTLTPITTTTTTIKHKTSKIACTPNSSNNSTASNSPMLKWDQSMDIPSSINQSTNSEAQIEYPPIIVSIVTR